MSEAKENKKPLYRFVRTPFARSTGASLISILIGILCGFLIMLICASFANADPGEGFALLLEGPFSSKRYAASQFGTMLFYTGPLILTGLSVAVAYKTGLFNIGAPGQFLMGTLGSLLVALSINTTGNRGLGILMWLLAILVGIVLGILWALIPGALKAFFGINEVITCIMTNWIAANIVSWVFSTRPDLMNTGAGKTGYLIQPSVTGNYTPTLGLDRLFHSGTYNSYLDMGLILAVLLAVLMWFILNKTTLGYSMKACGYNKEAARYAGMKHRFYIMVAMGIAGGLAALAGSLYYLNPNIELQWQSVYQELPSYGFDGIPAAFLANCNPIGVIFAALFIRYLSASGTFLQKAGYNKYFADLIIAVIVYLSGFARFFRERIERTQGIRDKLGVSYFGYIGWKCKRFGAKFQGCFSSKKQKEETTVTKPSDSQSEEGGKK